MFGNFDIEHMIFLGITFVISISIHEFAHARTSTKLGDPTPKIQGRLTPNPLVHIDPMGFILIFIIGFGWGRPVIVNPSYYKNPIRDELLVALAGPISNIVLAFAGMFIINIYGLFIGVENFLSSPQTDLIKEFRETFATLNIVLAVFNMIPIPPLDGYRLLVFFFPKTQAFMQRYTMYFGILLLGLIFLPGVKEYTFLFIKQIGQFIYGILNILVAGLFFW